MPSDSTPPAEPAGAVADAIARVATYEADLETTGTVELLAIAAGDRETLAAEVDRLAGEVAKLTGALRLARDVYAAQKGRIEGERDRLAEENARLREALADLVNTADAYGNPVRVPEMGRAITAARRVLASLTPKENADE